MEGSVSFEESSNAYSTLLHLSKGELLGVLEKRTAEKAFRLYRSHAVDSLVWKGNAVVGTLQNSKITVHVGDGENARDLACHCSSCGIGFKLCHHAVTSLIRWFDVRATLVRMGVGSSWRAHSRHPFIGPKEGPEDRIDLSHLRGADLRSALEFQVSLQKSGLVRVRLVDQEVRISIKLPSGDTRVAVFSASLLARALPILNSMPRIKLEGELEGLEVSEIRLRPVLMASWKENGILLEPGFKLGNRSILLSSELKGRIHGRWARVGRHLCLLHDAPTPLVPFLRKGRKLLSGRDALSFLRLDHPQLSKHSWYLPQGSLKEFSRALIPRLDTLDVEVSPKGEYVLKPVFRVGKTVLEWEDIGKIFHQGFARFDEGIVQMPDFRILENAGFNLKNVRKGLVGDRISLIRLIAETDVSVRCRDGGVRDLVSLLRGDVLADPGPPDGLRSKLRPYQAEGVTWLWQRWLAGIGALLADDMGLGKTHQVMGLFCHIRRIRPTARILVICPRGVLEHWKTLLEEYAPEIGVHVFHGSNRVLPKMEESNVPVLLTTYDILVRSHGELAGRDWDLAVFDEAQRIKNPRTKAARASKKLKAAFKIALSGTPLENRLLELWSVVDLIMPGYLRSETEFRRRYRNPGREDLEILRKQLGILTLRRLKEQVLSDLPDKVEDLRFCTMTPEQRKMYEDVRGGSLERITEALNDTNIEIPYMHIFSLMTRLKQICDYSSLGMEEKTKGSSGKLEVFDEILNEAVESNQQVVVFSQYVRMLEILSRHLETQGRGHLVLTGSTRDRGRVIRRFNGGQHEKILLASLLAGGVGIDLTGASVVIHYDRWWNPAKENQATDRVHRMGQRRFVQVFKFMTRNSIEERIDRLITRKRKLFDEVVGPTENVMRRLGRKELAELLDIELKGVMT